VSVPCRYIHSPNSLLRLDDFGHTVRLVREFVLKAEAVCERVGAELQWKRDP